jgi:KDO2-lipid IV(A) lauroyltransferase
MKTIKYFFEALLIYLSFIIIKLIGLNNSRKLFSYIFNFIGPLIKSKNIIDINLNTVFPGISEKEKKKKISEMWSNYAMTFVEYIYLFKFKKDNSHINIKGKEILKKIIDNNKPVIFVSGHFANFELMSMELTKLGTKLATIYRPLNNFFLNPFMEYLRKKYICKNQIKKGLYGTRDIIKFLNKKNCIALMIDQRVSEGVKIPFFKKIALTTSLPAQLALKYNYEIVPIFISRNKENKFEMEVQEPIKILDAKFSDRNKIGLSTILNEVLEKMIIKSNGQWIWTHNRWK